MVAVNESTKAIWKQLENALDWMQILRGYGSYSHEFMVLLVNPVIKVGMVQDTMKPVETDVALTKRN